MEKRVKGVALRFEPELQAPEFRVGRGSVARRSSILGWPRG